MSYRHERIGPVRQRRGPRGCLIALTMVVWLVVIGFVALRYWARPSITGWVEDQVARAIDPQLPPELASEDALRRSLEQVPVAPALPSGELRVSEDEANAYLADYRSLLPGIDDIHVEFVAGEIQATLNVSGFQSTLRLTPTVRDGRIVADGAELGQPLGSFLSIDGLLGALTDRINADLGAQGRRITGLTVIDGVAVVNVE